MVTSETYVIKLPMYLFFIWRLDFDGGRSITRAIGLDFFGAQIELASLVAISGPKKSTFSGPTPSNGY
jgi:hypothetical protein